MYLTVLLALLPIIPAVLFMLSPMPDMSGGEGEGEVGRHSGKRAAGLAVCVACIFFGSCAENTMSNWVSTYMENALQIDKTLGDILGMAMFAILLGLARISYAKFGKNIMRVLLVGMIGAAVCYITVGLSTNVILVFAACILTGLFSSMLWPGTLIMMEENMPGLGVAAYALMAASGDLGASVAPQLVGVITDGVIANPAWGSLASSLSITVEQLGMKLGMLCGTLFPLIGIFVYLYIWKKKTATEANNG
jgi:MFS family permease